jgi:hypothetical protein
MSLIAFDNYLQYVDKVIASTKTLLPEVEFLELESVLVTQGVVVLYARMEQCFQQVLESKCSRCGDAEVRAFALSVKKDKAGKLSLQNVKEVIGRFGIDHRVNFSPLIDTLGVSTSWDSIVGVRQRIAHHGERASFGLGDLKQYYSDIRSVLGCICKAMTLSEVEAIAICSSICFPK